jgi:hypothetical protein
MIVRMIVSTLRSADAVADQLEDGVADLMIEPVVDVLELVDVEMEQRDLAVRADGQGYLSSHRPAAGASAKLRSRRATFGRVVGRL